VLLALAFLATGAARPLRAQTVVGRVLDDARESPVSGAAVRLLDKDGKKKAEALADAMGRFVITPPREGEYYLEATRIGYQRALTPLLRFAARDDRVELDLMMTPAPIGLEGFAVEVDLETRASEDLKLSGVRPTDLGNRWVSRADIDAVAIRPDLGNVLEYQSIAGIRIIRPENMVPGGDDLGLCVSLARARTGSGQGTCALVVLDGVPISGEQALFVDPESVEGMAVLLPTEATTLYGTKGARGALMIWTRRGGGR
jgi:hypothetical protein